jgi:hypothetical protein
MVYRTHFRANLQKHNQGWEPFRLKKTEISKNTENWHFRNAFPFTPNWRKKTEIEKKKIYNKRHITDHSQQVCKYNKIRGRNHSDPLASSTHTQAMNCQRHLMNKIHIGRRKSIMSTARRGNIFRSIALMFNFGKEVGMVKLGCRRLVAGGGYLYICSSLSQMEWRWGISVFQPSISCPKANTVPRSASYIIKIKHQNTKFLVLKFASISIGHKAMLCPACSWSSALQPLSTCHEYK